MKCSYLKYVLAVCLLVLILSSCKEDEPTGFTTDAPTPSITSVDPDTALFLQPVTITGKNFHPDPTQNIIRFGYNSTFGYATARAHAGNSTSLEFYTPGVAGEYEPYIATVLSVTRTDAAYYSDTLGVHIAPVTSIFRDDFTVAKGIASDPEGNIYCCDTEEGVIYKITQEGDRTVYSETAVGSQMTFRDGWLYLSTHWDGPILRIPPGGGDAEVFSEDFAYPYDLDWDENGNMWVIESWWDGDEGTGGIYRRTPDGEVTHFDDIFVEHGVSIRVFDGYVYWSDRGMDWEGEGLNQIMKAPIIGDGLGTPEVVFEDNGWTGDYLWGCGGMDIDSEGNVYAVSGIDQNANLCKFKPDGTAEVLFVFVPGMRFITISGEFLYLTTYGGGSIIKVFIGIEGAPQY